VRLRWWEIAGLALPLLAAGLFYASGHWVGGTVVVSAVIFVAASRARIIERNIAGFHARMRGTLLLLRAIALFSVYVLLVYGWFVMRSEHWTRDRHGLVAFYATAGLAIFLVRDIRQLGNEADRWLRGGETEEAVAAELDPLREEGWVAVHNVVRDDGGGNVDHFVSSPDGVAFAIETKAGRLRAADRGQAISNAIWAKEKFGARFVTAVVCVGTDAPEEPLLVRHGNATVWILGRSQLGGLLRSRADS
jgi:Nuclease-related domain